MKFPTPDLVDSTTLCGALLKSVKQSPEGDALLVHFAKLLRDDAETKTSLNSIIQAVFDERESCIPSQLFCPCHLRSMFVLGMMAGVKLVEECETKAVEVEQLRRMAR